MKNPFRILCAVDASRPAAAAFEQALAMSARRGAQLVLVHAVSKDRPYSWRAVERVSALAALRERAEAQNVPVRVRVQHGDVAGVILLHARAHAPDLIVLGSHEPVGLARFRFRSIADRVVKGAECPVLLIPAAHTARHADLPNNPDVRSTSLHDRQERSRMQHALPGTTRSIRAAPRVPGCSATPVCTLRRSGTLGGKWLATLGSGLIRFWRRNSLNQTCSSLTAPGLSMAKSSA